MNAKILVCVLALAAPAVFAARCTYSLSPTSGSYGSGGGSGSFAVTTGAGCAWAATTSATWIQTASAATNSGTVSYTVGANLTTSARTGTILVAGSNFTVNQAGAAMNLGLALDNSELSWSTGPDYPWIGTTAPSYDGISSAVSGNRYVQDSTSYLETTVTGPGTLSFWWKVDSDVTPPPPEPDPYSWDALQFAIDSETQDMIRGQIDWNYRVYVIPEGEHLLRWSYSKDSQYNLGQDRGWVDQVIYTTNAPISLGEALDVCGVQWWTGGNANPTVWSGETSVSHDGKSAARSGALSGGQESTMRAVVSGVTNVSFWWKVSSEATYDWLEFYTNGTLATRISGEVNWTSNFFKLSPAANTLTWRYAKNYADMGPKGSDCGWVDQVKFSSPLKPNIVAYPTNLSLGTSSSNCQAALPDLTQPQYFTLGEACTQVTISQSPLAGTLLPVGTTTVVITASNVSGATSVTNITEVADATPPLITLLGSNPLTVQCHTAFIDPGATAVDSCGSGILLSTNSAVDAQMLGSYAMEYVATDEHGNSATNTRLVIVVDTEAPHLLQPLAAQTLGADANCTALVPNLVSMVQAADNCSGSVTVVQSPAAGTVLTLGSSAVTLALNDGNGNTNYVGVLVTVEDRTLPVIATQPASSTNQSGTRASFFVSASACSSLAYQWYFNGNALAGEILPSLTVASVNSSDSGSYVVVITSSAGSVTSAPALLVIQQPEQPTPATITSQRLLPNGSFRLTFVGQTNRTYKVLASSDPALPMGSWTQLGTGTFSGEVTFTDTDASDFPQRFYRILSE